MNVGEAMRWAKAEMERAGIDSPRLDAEVLLAHVLKTERTGIIVRPERVLSEAEEALFRESVARRARHEPVAYIVGRKEFYGRDFIVNPHVLIPRPESEFLVDTVCERAPAQGTVFEIGVGSGAVICSILAERGDLRGIGNDISVEAVKVARLNAHRTGVRDRLSLYAGAYMDGFTKEVDVIVANPPYLSEEDLAGAPLDVAGFEPMHALWGGKDGLGVVQGIIARVPRCLAPGGILVVEVGKDQADAVEMCAKRALALEPKGRVRDFSGTERVLIFTRLHG